MRIRSSAASIAALLVTVGLLAGCTAAAPEADPPAASTPAAEPSPSATPAAAPDLADLCEQLLPLETVQERFGDDTVLLTSDDPSPVPDMARWSGLARGNIQCSWGASGDPYWDANAVLLVRSDDAEFDELRRSSDEYPNERERLDAVGSSVDWCFDREECQFAAARPEGGWVGLVLRPDAGGNLLDTETIRERWTPTIKAVLDAAPSVTEVSMPEAGPHVACVDLLATDEARDLLGDQEAFLSDPRDWGEGGTFVTEKWHIAFNADGCTWSSGLEADSITVYAVRAPAWAREAAFDDVVAEADQFIGERLDVDGVDDAWRYRYVGDHDVSGSGGTYDLLVDGLWLEVTIGSGQESDRVLSAIVANLARTSA